MTAHVSDDTLFHLALGEGAAAERAHVAACEACARRVEETRLAVELAQRAEVPEPPPFYWQALPRVAYSRDGGRVAVLVDDPRRCETCTALEVFDATRGDLVQRVPLETVVAPRFSTIGLDGDTAWIFEHVPRSISELATRPERCQYQSYDLATRQRRPAPPADWGIADCTLWALAPRYDGPGVIGLARERGKLRWLVADVAP